MNFEKRLNEAIWNQITGGAPPGGAHPFKILKAPNIWFHGTSDIFHDLIFNKGLIPKIIHANAKTPSLHLTQDRKLALFSARRAAQRFGGNPMVLAISLDNLDIELTGTKIDSYTSSIIPISALKQLRTK
jgi:hypothetical protein